MITWLRSRTGEKRLTGLAVSSFVHIYRDIVFDAGAIIDRSAEEHKIFIDLLHINKKK